MTTIKSQRHQMSFLKAIDEFKKLPYIKEVYLFGNCVTGTPKYDSDVDFFVRVDDSTSPTTMRKLKSDLYMQPELDIKFFRVSSSPPESFTSMLAKEGVRVL